MIKISYTDAKKITSLKTHAEQIEKEEKEKKKNKQIEDCQARFVCDMFKALFA